MYAQPFVTALNALYVILMGLVTLAGSAVFYKLVASFGQRLPNHPISTAFANEDA